MGIRSFFPSQTKPDLGVGSSKLLPLLASGKSGPIPPPGPMGFSDPILR